MGLVYLINNDNQSLEEKSSFLNHVVDSAKELDSIIHGIVYKADSTDFKKLSH